MRTLSAFLLLFLFQMSRGQVTLRITGIPASTPAGSQYYLAGSLNNWNPADPTFRFQLVNGIPELQLPAGNGTIEYKITRGSWATCEGSNSGAQIPNRKLTYSAGLVAQINIAGWENQGGGTSTALPQVSVLEEDFYIPQLNRTRRVWIYLPKDYTASGKRYPVLYMHDGQNVFDAATSFAGEWGVDEVLDAREKAGKNSCIVVAVDNGGIYRLDEYSPFINPQRGGGQGTAYVDFLVHTLKPHIDSFYRTEPDRLNTGIAGSSMGGLISLYATLRYPQVYGKAGIFSPAFWFSDSLYQWVLQQTMPSETRMYFVAGASESQSLVAEMDKMIGGLRQKGFDTINIRRLVWADGAHSEWFWKREFGPAFEWLFSDVSTRVAQTPEEVEYPYPNPVTDTLILPGNPEGAVLVRDMQGKEEVTLETTGDGSVLRLNSLKPGIYMVIYQLGQRRIQHQIIKK